MLIDKRESSDNLTVKKEIFLGGGFNIVVKTIYPLFKDHVKQHEEKESLLRSLVERRETNLDPAATFHTLNQPIDVSKVETRKRSAKLKCMTKDT